jgi:hypothetical protein
MPAIAAVVSTVDAIGMGADATGDAGHATLIGNAQGTPSATAAVSTSAYVSCVSFTTSLSHACDTSLPCMQLVAGNAGNETFMITTAENRPPRTTKSTMMAAAAG